MWPALNHQMAEVRRLIPCVRNGVSYAVASGLNYILAVSAQLEA